MKNTNVPAFGMVKSNPKDVKPGVQEIVFYEEGNPRCVVNLLPGNLRDRALGIPPHFHMLETHVLEKEAQPSDIERQLRLAFWDEFSVACDNKKVMRMESVYARITSREYFHTMVVNNPAKFALILRPPQDYVMSMRSLLEAGMRRFQEILSLPITKRTKTTKVAKDGSSTTHETEYTDTKLISEIVKIVSLVDNRVKGSVTQKIQIDQKSVNVSMEYEAPKSYEDIQRELKSIQSNILEVESSSSSQNLLPVGAQVVEARRNTRAKKT